MDLLLNGLSSKAAQGILVTADRSPNILLHAHLNLEESRNMFRLLPHKIEIMYSEIESYAIFTKNL